MRDEERIPEVLDIIKTVWERYPDLRLGQLILNAVDNSTTLYYLEEEDLINALDSCYHFRGKEQ